MQKTLRLVIKKQYFDMILKGTKKEEYREVKDYYMQRIVGRHGCGTGYNFTILRDLGFNALQQPFFDTITFVNGYAKDARQMVVECNGVIVDKGKKCWGAPNYRVFVLKLGSILTKNFKETSNE